MSFPASVLREELAHISHLPLKQYIVYFECLFNYYQLCKFQLENHLFSLIKEDKELILTGIHVTDYVCQSMSCHNFTMDLQHGRFDTFSAKLW